MNASLFGAYAVAYDYEGKRVLDEVSFEIEEKEILAILGPNGSGKSTLLKAISGVLPIHEGQQGQVRFKGTDFLKMDSATRARSVAYVGAETRADFPMTAYETVTLGRICHGSGLLKGQPSEDEKVVEWAMKECLCWDLRDRDLATLSGGERQLVTLARALAQGAKVLLLDEALSKMDLNHVALVTRMLKRRAEEGSAVIIVSHDVNVAAAFAGSALLLRKGKKLAYGKLKEVLTKENLSQLYPGADLHVGAATSGVPHVTFGS